MEQSYAYKTKKHEDLKKDLEKKSGMIVKAVEMGARGFVEASLYQFLLEITENSSMWIGNNNIPRNNSK